MVERKFTRTNFKVAVLCEDKTQLNSFIEYHLNSQKDDSGNWFYKFTPQEGEEATFAILSASNSLEATFLPTPLDAIVVLLRQDGAQDLQYYKAQFEQKVGYALYKVFVSTSDKEQEQFACAQIAQQQKGITFDSYSSKSLFERVYLLDIEFVKLMSTVFNSFDKDGSGSIDIKELGAVSKELGQDLAPEQLQGMMADLDINKDGVIDFNELSHWWRSGKKGRNKLMKNAIRGKAALLKGIKEFNSEIRELLQKPVEVSEKYHEVEHNFTIGSQEKPIKAFSTISITSGPNETRDAIANLFGLSEEQKKCFFSLGFKMAEGKDFAQIQEGVQKSYQGIQNLICNFKKKAKIIFEDSQIGPKILDMDIKQHNDMVYIILKVNPFWINLALEQDDEFCEVNNLANCFFSKNIKQVVKIDVESANGFEEIFMNKEHPIFEYLFNFLKIRLQVKWNKCLADLFVLLLNQQGIFLIFRFRFRRFCLIYPSYTSSWCKVIITIKFSIGNRRIHIELKRAFEINGEYS